jgi:3-oxoacyl-[acyl-carrier-protein] synthase-3
MNSAYGIGIIGVGHCLPKQEDTNEELCKDLVDVSPAWILEKTGIKRRFVAQPGDSASSYSIEAARHALKMAGIEPHQLKHYIFPPVSAKIQMELGAKDAQIYDIQANCSGFVTGLTAASDRMLVDETVEYSLVVGVELHTRYIDRKDVNTSIYFSDGAGAVVLAKVPKGEGIIASSFFTDSSNYEAVRFRGGGSTHPLTGRQFDPGIDFIEMNGLATWKQAVTHLPITVRKVLEKAKLTAKDINLFLFHQANLNLIHYVVRKIGEKIEKTHTNVEDIGNTGAASVAIVLSEAVALGKIKAGDTVLLASVGAGFNFGASIWKWSHTLPASGKTAAQSVLEKS